MTATIIALPVQERRPLPRKAQPGIKRRLAEIGKALELDAAEIDHASIDLDAVVEFTWRHNQSLDWVLLGRHAVMIRRLSRCR